VSALRRLLLALCAALLVSRLPAAEVILDYRSHIEVAEDAGMLVTETIRVRAEGARIHHGIFRDFPNLYPAKWGLRSGTGFRVVSVRRDGQDEPWHTEPRVNGVRVYVGDAATNVSVGEHVYELTYATDRQLGFFADHDELYWNVTGNGWDFPIEHVSAEVRLPAKLHVTAHEAYTGPAGAKGRDYTDQPDPAAMNVARFATTRRLGPREGLTVVVSWPHGLIHAAVDRNGLFALMAANPDVSLGLLGIAAALSYYLVVWVLVGRDPAPGIIIPLYAPPPKFSPAAVRMLSQMGYDRKCYVANLINLAVKGALKITERDDAVTIRRLGAYTTLLPDEKALFDTLLGPRPEMTFEASRQEIVRQAQDELKANLSSALDKIFFVRNLGWWIGGLVLSLGPGLFAAADDPSAWTIGILAAGLVLNGMFYFLLKAPTLSGRHILDQIEGFRRFLSVAESDRLNLENPPNRTPALFDRFLPYALALGVEQQWAQQFADVLASAEYAGQSGYTPSWYSGSSYSPYRFDDFGRNLGGSLDTAIAAAAAPPGSTSGSSGSGGFSLGGGGGFSGGGGGGSSGGGGGGGGGGGW
jgi:uncharacterized membrane protein YgcG